MRRTEMSPGDVYKLKGELQRLDSSVDEIRAQATQTEKLLENREYTAKIVKREVKLRTLLIISVQPASTTRAEIAAGRQPRRDYAALQQALDADLLFPDDALKTRLGRLIKRILGARISLAWAAFCCRHAYDILYTDTEIVGLPLAMLLKLGRVRPGHPRYVALSHYLSPLKKRIWFWFGVGSHICTMIVHSAAQRVVATSVLHIPAERVVRLPFQVDVNFWHPLAPSDIGSDLITSAEQRPIICVPGLECRDYPTLLSAVRGLDVNVYISTRFITPEQAALAKLPDWPENVSFKKYDYEALRQLYSTARFIVVPLLEVDFQAGVTVILEAMAMGKAVIASGIRGQTDVLRDPRNDGHGPVVREWWPSFLETSSFKETLGRLPTGFYVKPGDPNELRSSIQYLLDHPEVAEELGRNGRRVAEAYFDLDAFTQRFAAAILDKPLPTDVASHKKPPESRG